MADFFKELVTVLLGAGGVSVVFGALVKSWFTLQLEKFKREQSAQLEAIKADLSVVAKLRSTAEERKAQVAGEVLVGALRYLDALSAVVSLGMWAAPADAERDSKMTAEYEARWKFAEPFAEEFRRAWVAAEVFLPEDAADLMEALWKEKAEIQANQMTAIAMAGQRGPGFDPSFHKRGYGQVPKGALDDLRARFKGTLRPLAQLQGAASRAAA
jgi:hypothetical protein